MQSHVRKMLCAAIGSLFVCLAVSAQTNDKPLYTWSRSLPVNFQSPGIGTLGGTEARSLVAFDGKLFAGIGYWRDTEQDNPKLPGAQVLVLDAANGTWKVDLALDDVVQLARGLGVKIGRRRYLAIGAMAAFDAHQDAAGKPLQNAVPFLLSSVWNSMGGLQLFTRGAGANVKWSSTDLMPSAAPFSQVRSFGSHTDAVTHREMFFAGANPGGVYAGTFDGSANFILWNHAPETWDSDSPKDSHAQSRVMAFAECNDKLYATSGFQLFERQDGLHPSWKKIYVDENPSKSTHVSGYRGMTAVPAVGGGEELLIAVEEGRSRILRIDPRKLNAKGMASATIELNISAFLTNLWNTPVKYALPAYNDMLRVRLPGTNCDSFLIGFESTTPNAPDAIGGNGKHPYAHYFVRRCDVPGRTAKYDVQRIEDPAFPGLPLVSTRSIAASPFHDDPPGTIYASGLDAGNLTVHNSAWIYKGVPTK